MRRRRSSFEARSALPGWVRYVSSKPMPVEWNPRCALNVPPATLPPRLTSSTTPADMPPLYPAALSHTRQLPPQLSYYLRQAALLRAIDPKTTIELPPFSSPELVFLSYRPDVTTLPRLPHARADLHFRFQSQSRIALERIYRDSRDTVGQSVFSCLRHLCMDARSCWIICLSSDRPDSPRAFFRQRVPRPSVANAPSFTQT